MTNLFNNRWNKAGLAPGTLGIPQHLISPAQVSVMSYSVSGVEESVPGDLGGLVDCLTTPEVTWIDVVGVRDEAVMNQLGRSFNLHPLVLEDIVHTSQRPKLEDYEDFIYLVFKMIRLDPSSATIVSEQVSLLLFENVVISFQEQEGDVFEPVRDRIRHGKGRIRKMGADYLMYALLDGVVDHYFNVLERASEQLEAVEERLLSCPNTELLADMHAMKKDFVYLRKAIWPLREAISTLERSESPLFRSYMKPFIRDVYDHAVQVMDTMETCRDVLSGLLDLYLSVVSNRMNDVMKMLTIIATIFIPITFVAGIYGMNFEVMPELKWAWGYPTALGVMLVIAGSMLLYFRKKEWI